MNFLFDSEIADRALEGVSITSVVLSPDGGRARLLYTVTNDSLPEHPESIEAALKRASSFFRQRLCDALSLKRTPELRFAPDLAATATEGEREGEEI